MPPKIAPSANFRNPLGLLGRMLLSGKRAAYSALIHEAIRLIARPLDGLLASRNRRMIEAAGKTPSGEPVLLVVGAPRSGTTLVYQTLAQFLDVSYFSNLTSFFPKSAIAGSKMFSWLTGKGSVDFHNFYGQTAGLSGPNHGFSIWNQWLGEDRYVPRSNLSESEMAEMRSFFDSWTRTFGKPFLNKNNRNTACLDQLSRAIPSATFIVVRRNPLRVAQSLINARAQVQGDKTVGWGLHATDLSDASDPLSYVDDVCDQILQIEEELDQQLQEIPENRRIEITYEGFCEDPASALTKIENRVPGVRLLRDRVARDLKPFKPSAGISLSIEEQKRILERLASVREHRAGRSEAAAVTAP
ncbi:MAG: sulfotransferase family protein [Planctomyces sp.]